MSPYCIPGKRGWMKKYYRQLARNMIFTGAKTLLAGTGRLLIDDNDENVKTVREAGESAVLVPRLWNSRLAMH